MSTMSAVAAKDRGAGGREMRLGELLERAGVSVAPSDADELVVSEVTDDSRRVGPGGLFVAVRGESADGHDYVSAAIAAGASAVVAQEEVAVPAGIPLIRVPDSRSAVARLAAAFVGLDEIQSKGLLRVVGVTGTNGKSTVCYLIRNILSGDGRRTAMLGTVIYDLLSRQLPAPMTTPSPVRLAEHLVEASQAGATDVVMEVSSHALDQRRIDGLDLAVGVFTNLSGDHLDYHGDMQRYLGAKKRLFDSLSADSWAVVNAEDEARRPILADCRARSVTYGFSGQAEVRAAVASCDLSGSEFELFTPAGSIRVSLALIGRHNVANALAAAAAATVMGVDLERIRQGLEGVRLVPGRLQAVGAGGDAVTVLVDYAHTDDALSKVLQAVRPMAEGRMVLVFGCGGQRDRSKRPRMGRVAARLADVVIVTSDNPRREEPETIIEQILAGIDGSDMARVRVEPDRRAAIERAIALADAGDVVLIAGKGHETYQDVGGRRVAFDDVEVASAALAGRLGEGA